MRAVRSSQKWCGSGLPLQHFVDGEQHLVRYQCWPQVAERLHRTGGLCPPCRQHAVPVGPGHTIRGTDLPRGQGHRHRRVQFFGPAGTPPRLVVRNHLQGQRRQIIALQQRGHLQLLGLTNNLPMGAHKSTDAGIGQNLILVRLPAKQAGHRGKRQFLG